MPASWNVEVAGGSSSPARATRLQQRGRNDSARNYYREFLRRYDRPVIGHRRLVEEAKTAMLRLTGRGE